MRVIVIAATVLGLAGCASDRVDFGGIANPAALSEPVIPCEDAGLSYAERAPLDFPVELLQLAYFAQSDGFRVETPFEFDVNRAGEAINLRFVGDEAMTRSGSRRAAVKAAADHLLASRFAWPDHVDARYAVGCRETIDFGTRYSREP